MDSSNEKWIEVNSRSVRVNLIPYRPHAVEHLIGQTADQMLSGVHSHVCISGLPIDRAATSSPISAGDLHPPCDGPRFARRTSET